MAAVEVPNFKALLSRWEKSADPTEAASFSADRPRRFGADAGAIVRRGATFPVGRAAPNAAPPAHPSLLSPRPVKNAIKTNPAKGPPAGPGHGTGARPGAEAEKAGSSFVSDASVQTELTMDDLDDLRQPAVSTDIVPFGAYPPTSPCSQVLCAVASSTKGMAAEVRASLKDLASDPRMQAVAASAAGGAVALGTGGGVTGFLTGGTIGAVAGIIPAPLTFGLSIPLGVAVGSGAGTFLGSAIGGTLGLLGGGIAGHCALRVYTKAAVPQGKC